VLNKKIQGQNFGFSFVLGGFILFVTKYFRSQLNRNSLEAVFNK
jgi:hypothetical protein